MWRKQTFKPFLRQQSANSPSSWGWREVRLFILYITTVRFCSSLARAFFFFAGIACFRSLSLIFDIKQLCLSSSCLWWYFFAPSSRPLLSSEAVHSNDMSNLFIHLISIIGDGHAGEAISFYKLHCLSRPISLARTHIFWPKRQTRLCMKKQATLLYKLLLRNTERKERAANSSKMGGLQHRVFPGGHPSRYWPGPTMLDFGDRTRTGVFMVVWS